MIYLDSAATTLQKPPEVERAVVNAIRSFSSPGRGDHAAALAAAEAVFEVRKVAAAYFSMKETSRVIFTSNATHALNIAIKGFTYPGDEVVVSCLEHNAVMRPLFSGGRRIRIAEFASEEPAHAAEAFERAITRRTKCVICTLVSNVFGCILPCAKIGRICKAKGIIFIVDASQAAGCLPICPEELHADAICMPGHKGLYGPQGTGLLLLPGDRFPRTLMEGGTGSSSSDYRQPDLLPDRYESGTHNVPGIVGLGEGIRYVQRRGETRILYEERLLIEQLIRSVRKRFYMPGRGDPLSHIGLLALQPHNCSCEDAAAFLARKGIAVRSGFCCAPLAHRSQRIFEKGILRISVSDFNTAEEIEAAAAALNELS